jgi:hypothetical protein
LRPSLQEVSPAIYLAKSRFSSQRPHQELDRA